MMFQKIAVLGAGTMGHGIAQLFAQNGIYTAVYDPSTQALENAVGKVQRNIKLSLNMQESPAATSEQIESKLLYTSNLSEAISEADLIIEAAPEKIEIKRELYRQIAPLMKAEAVMASNTSTYALEELASGVPFADRMIIMHFFNPASLVPLVEIVGLSNTDKEILEQIAGLLVQCGKAPVILNRDIPGFIANRLQAAVMREASYLLENGIADARQIDTVMTEGLGIRWVMSGPFEIADYGGLDVWEKVTGHLFPELDTRITAPDAIQEKVRNGQLGVKSGSGFYDYGDEEQRNRLSEERDQRWIQLLQLKERTGKSQEKLE
ncbi:3-hydroxyacyl-CoA dehydrogenase family protein [Paenibacillus eucommiae]|uniref:3-hydroxybutyryl-CoA dehydrogenase n=1 Tax=Paenibacillus eucommiae TaxID=1355755 RepID=A0ABS4J2M1_9BACL|nr:3-hydroxyacyl-CoA dehydrogenase family protein [Paenibacillus eucommiae]MBP1994033.1 3-hydroxybutyryl-CoA dehydrogenase [Paenibacillus eucommiae]